MTKLSFYIQETHFFPTKGRVYSFCKGTHYENSSYPNQFLCHIKLNSDVNCVVQYKYSSDPPVGSKLVRNISLTIFLSANPLSDGP